MKQSSGEMPEPRGFEHELIAQAGSLPALSTGLRERILVDCQRQVRRGKTADQLRVLASVLAMGILLTLVWKFRWTTPSATPDRTADAVAEQPPEEPQVVPYRSPGTVITDQGSPAGSPKRAVGRMEEPREMQQLNRLIEDLTERQNALCGVLPFHQPKL